MIHDLLHLAYTFLTYHAPGVQEAFVGTTAALLGGGAILGGIAGAAGSNKSKTDSLRLDLDPATAGETNAENMTNDSLSKYLGLADAGPGAGDVANSTGAQRDLASMLQQYAQSGGLPTGDDITQGNNLASGLFNARRTALGQDFTQQNTDAARLAARLGRPVNDPIIQAKLRTGYMNQTSMLDAEQSDAGNQIAMGLPGQRLNYAGQRVNLLDSLAGQAFKNRAAILEAGSSILNSDRNFRVATAGKVGTSNENSGGGIGGAITGALGGLGSAMGVGSKFGLFSGGGNDYAPSGAVDGINAGMFGMTPSSSPSAGVSSRNITGGTRGVSAQPFDFMSAYPIGGQNFSTRYNGF